MVQVVEGLPSEKTESGTKIEVDTDTADRIGEVAVSPPADIVEAGADGRTDNADKAHELANVEEDIRTDLDTKWKTDPDIANNFDWYGDKPYEQDVRAAADPKLEAVGNEYELQSLAERLGKSEEQVTERMAKDLETHFQYGLSMIANKEKYNEKLTLGEEAFQAIAGFAAQHEQLVKQGGLIADRGKGRMGVRIELVPLQVNVRGEHETVGSFLKFGVLTEESKTPKREWQVMPSASKGTYTETVEEHQGSAEGWDDIDTSTTRSRKQRPEDLQTLKDSLARIAEMTE